MNPRTKRSSPLLGLSQRQPHQGEVQTIPIALDRRLQRGRRQGRSRSARWLLPLLTLLLTGLYVLTGPGNRTEADDAFGYAYDVEHRSFRELFLDASHILFLPLARGGLNMLRLVGVDLGAYDAIRLMNCLLAALAVVLFGVLLRSRFGLSPFAAATGAAGLAISYGFWRYANEADLYPTVVLMFVALCLIAFSGLRSITAVVLAAAVAAFGTLFYVMSIVSAVVLVPAVLVLRRRIRDAVIYGAVFVLITGAVSYGAYRYAAPPHQTFGRYLLGERSTDYSASAIPKSIISIAQDVATTNWVFAYDTVGQRLAAVFPSQYLIEEQYVGDRSDAVVHVVPLLTVPLLILLSAAVLWSLRHRVRAHELRRSGQTQALLVVAIWIGVDWLILIGPSSSAPEAWIPMLPAVWICVATVIFMACRTRASRILVVAFLLALMVHNLAGGFWMMHSQSTDLNAVKSQWLVDNARAGDLILTADGLVFKRYLQYHTTAKVVGLDELPVGQIPGMRGLVAAHGRVFATAAVFDPPSQLRAEPTRFAAIEGFATAVQPQFRTVVKSPVGDVYQRG
jgi:hypothetical protein